MPAGNKNGNKNIKETIEKAQRKAYLHAKGVDPASPFQLDLLFPGTVGTRNDLRHIPNDYARSSLFTARNKSTTRRALSHQKLFHYSEHVSILYTGPELRAEDDELVWLQILNYAQKVPFGEPFEFSIKDLVKDIGWHRNGRYYDKARECISRLKASEILALNDKAYGTSGAISLIQSYIVTNDDKGNPTTYTVFINPNLIVLFAGNTFTSHTWNSYRKLSPVARRLADYIESHKHPYPLALKKFQQMCDSLDASEHSWKQTVKKACLEVQAASIAATAFINKDDKIYCIIETDKNRSNVILKTKPDDSSKT